MHARMKVRKISYIYIPSKYPMNIPKYPMYPPQHSDGTAAVSGQHENGSDPAEELFLNVYNAVNLERWAGWTCQQAGWVGRLGEQGGRLARWNGDLVG